VKVCPECHRQYDDSVQFCIADAAKLLIVGGPDEDPFLNQVVANKYRIEKKLGEGGMGKIYLARHVTLGKRFAIKTLHPDFTRNQEALERFRREAITTAQLEHPNILGMADMDQMEDGTAYIVMEFLEGRELRASLNETPILPLPRAVHIFSQVCRALAAAHDKGIVHRDMKPENVFLVEREGDPDFVKVLDFGISKIRQAGSKLTQTGMVIGTPHYMSPEQARGDSNLDHRSDIYTIGAMLYEALTGRLPVQADNPTGVLVKILTEQPPPPSAVNPGIPPAVEQVILRAMAKDPNARFASCRELSKALQQASGIMDGSTAYAAAVSAGMMAARPPTGMVPGMPPPPTGVHPPTGMAPGIPMPPSGMRPPGVPPTAVTPGAGMAQPPLPGAPPGFGTPAGSMAPGMPAMPTPGGGYPGAPPMAPGAGPPPAYATGPTPMAWPQQASTGTTQTPARKSSMLPLFIVLFLVLAGGAGALVYFFVLRDQGAGKTTTAAPAASADAGIVKASADVGGPVSAADAGTTVAAADAATAPDPGTAAAEPETTVAAAPDAAPAPETTNVAATGPDAGPAPTPDAAPELVQITFITTPQQAKVYLVKADGTEQELCQTACQYEFPKSDDEIRVVFRKSGFRDQPATFRASESGMVNTPLDRIRAGQRDAGAMETVTMEVAMTPDAGTVVRRDAPVIVVPSRDAPVIVVPSRDAGPAIRLEAGQGVQQVDVGVRLREVSWGQH